MTDGRIQRDASALDGTYDVIVVGGGITGVNVAREFAGRGVTVLLVDKADFGQGTSSATTKYIHGGIRYLETRQFGVVRESLRERRLLTLAAPHLVSQRRFVMPAWRWSRPPTALIGAGVGAYTALGFDRNRRLPSPLRTPLPRWWTRTRLLARVPWLDPAELQGAFVYHDTLNEHPERLLLALLRTAVASGATAVNHAEATGFVVDRSAAGSITVTGVELVDRQTGSTHRAMAKAVVNAAGPWMDLVLARLGRPLGVALQRSKGVHLLCRPIGGDAGEDTVFARARSGKNVIVSPWQGYHFIGPTDTAVEDSPDDVRAVADDVDEILTIVNSTVAQPAQRLGLDDVADVTVGIRPLVMEEGKDTRSTSRRHELYHHARSGVHGLWSIAGGKWTTGRALGVETATTVLGDPGLAGVRTRPYDSAATGVLHGFGWGADPAPLFQAALTTQPSVALDPPTRDHLARLYGTEYAAVLDLVAGDPSLGQRVSERPGCLDIAAQVVRAVTHEGAVELSDIVDRRLTIGTLGPVGQRTLQRVASLAAPLLGWSAEQATTRAEAEHLRRCTRRALWSLPHP